MHSGLPFTLRIVHPLVALPAYHSCFHMNSDRIYIDEAKRLVQLPEELAVMMEPFPHLISFFQSMSFSHQREYISYILEAKKEVTRNKRMEKTIEMLQNLYQQHISKL